MYQKRKLISAACIVTVALMLMPLLLSCKKENDTNDTTGTEATTKEYLDDLGEFDFGGYEFNVLSVTSEDGTYTKFDVNEVSSMSLDNSIYYRNREIESRFNVKFVASDDLYQKCYSKLITQCESQTNDYDMIMLINRNAYAAAISGYLYPVEQLPHLDLTKDYYLHDINEMSSIKGKQFLAYSEESLYTFQRSTCIAFNKGMAENLQIPDIYSTVESGEWTFETFFEYAKRAVISDGINEPERFGIYGHGDYTFCTFFAAAGEKFIEKNNDTLKFTAGSNEKIDSIANTEISLIKDGTMGYSYDYKNPNDCYKVFTDEKTLFCTTVVGKLPLLRKVNWDYGVLPWPKYDSDQTQYSSRIVDAWLHVVPVTNPDPERASVILEALASGSLKLVFPAYYENYILGKTIRDNESVNMLEIVRSTRVFDWGSVTWAESIRAPIENQVFVNQSMSVSRVCQSQAKIVAGLIKEAEEGADKLIATYG